MTTTIISIPEDTPTTDIISAHNHEKTIDFSSVKKIYFHFLKNPAERELAKISYNSDNWKRKLRVKAPKLIDIDSHPHRTETTHHQVQIIHFKLYLNILHI